MVKESNAKWIHSVCMATVLLYVCPLYSSYEKKLQMYYLAIKMTSTSGDGSKVGEFSVDLFIIVAKLIERKIFFL